jgi:hypothetical protein
MYVRTEETREKAFGTWAHKRNERLMEEGLLSFWQIGDVFMLEPHSIRRRGDFPAAIPRQGRSMLYLYGEIRQWLLDSHPAYRLNHFAGRFMRGEFDAEWQKRRDRERLASRKMARKVGRKPGPPPR